MLLPYDPLPELKLDRCSLDPRYPLAEPLAPRFVFDELGGVNVCQPGRADAMESRFVSDDPFIGRWNELPPFERALLKFVAGRDVFVLADPKAEPARALNPFGKPLARDAVKKRCELEGAWLNDRGSALRPVGL